MNLSEIKTFKRIKSHVKDLESFSRYELFKYGILLSIVFVFFIDLFLLVIWMFKQCILL